MQKHYVLTDGNSIPYLGYGTFRISDGPDVLNSVLHAFQTGYRCIDTATLYGNETGIGLAVKASGLERSEVFVTTKVWNSDQGYEQTLLACRASLKRLSLRYVDLYLVHWPIAASFFDTWQAMELLHAHGRAKSIGVSNFGIEQLESLKTQAKHLPVVNQIEFHPQLQSPELVQYCQKNNILVQAWAPLARGEVQHIPEIQSMSEQLKCSPAQLTLAWMRARGIMPIPKSKTPARIDENYAIHSLSLSQDIVEKINALDCGRRLGPEPSHFWA